MAATNAPETLDAALTRPGRFDRNVVVSLPDVAGRREILALYLEGKPLAPDVDVDLMARCTPGELTNQRVVERYCSITPGRCLRLCCGVGSLARPWNVRCTAQH
jgi:SpoVK/Ycf46/Vps4 family AAA+-type ATPase